MSEALRLLGSQMSPYSVKLRSYLRYKGIHHVWIERGPHSERLFQRHATVQLIPLLLFPDDTAMQDTTPIMDHLEALHPEASVHPEEPAAYFVSALLEEFGDEWCNKLMFQYRWGPADRHSAATRILGHMTEGHPLRFAVPVMRPFVIRRMVPRLAFAGANETNRPHLEASWRRTVELLDAHLAERAYLFGARPAFGDFGIWGNLYQASTDPTCGAHVRTNAPHLVAWLERMLEPKAEGPFESFASLRPTLLPLLTEQVAGRFLAWSVANERAWHAGETRTSLSFDGAPYEQKTFKYHAWSLDQLRAKLAPVADDPTLRAVLADTGCGPFLEAST